jgi:hypothetical protein
VSLHPLTAPAPRRAHAGPAASSPFRAGTCGEARPRGRSSGPMTCRRIRSRRDAILLAAMGSPDPRQIDGLGGAHPLTSKAGIVSRSERPGVDLEFLFAQLQPDSDTVDTTANCGNMLAAVVPFAIESGLLVPDGDITSARVLTLNTGMVSEISVPTPAGRRRREKRYVEYGGDTRIDGVPGTAAAVDHQLPGHRRFGLRFTAAHWQRAGHREHQGFRPGGRDLHR